MAQEDEMVGLLNYCLFEPKSATPSIDTPLHGLLPFIHIDHLHPDAVIAIAASTNGQELTRKIWNNTVCWIPWQRPGFDLALKLQELVKAYPNLRGIVLGGHKLFTWGETSYNCYINTLEVIEQAANWLQESYNQNGPAFSGPKLQSLDATTRQLLAADYLPVFRGLAAQGGNRFIGHFTDNPAVLEFVNPNHLPKLARQGTSCPDHFLRTKIRPLVLNEIKMQGSQPEVLQYLACSFEQYRKEYAQYY